MKRRDTRIDTEDGIGLIEIVISIFLVALISISFLPLLLRTLTASTANTSTSSATQLVQASMDQAKSVTPATCAGVTAFVHATPAPVVDARGVSLSQQRQMGTCPTAFPGTVSVTATVTRTGSTIKLAESTTLIYVTGA